jgi:hypothetical protein
MPAVLLSSNSTTVRQLMAACSAAPAHTYLDKLCLQVLLAQQADVLVHDLQQQQQQQQQQQEEAQATGVLSALHI